MEKLHIGRNFQDPIYLNRRSALKGDIKHGARGETRLVVNKRDVTRDFMRRHETWQVGQAPVCHELEEKEDPSLVL